MRQFIGLWYALSLMLIGIGGFAVLNGWGGWTLLAVGLVSFVLWLMLKVLGLFGWAISYLAGDRPGDRAARLRVR